MTGEIHIDSIDIADNVKCTFVGIFVRIWSSKTGRHSTLTIKFKDKNNTYLNEILWVPKSYQERREMSYKLIDLFGVFGESFEEQPICHSWIQAYTNYIEGLNSHKGKEVYIKTVPKTHWKDKSEVEATLASNNFISNKPDLKYTILEANLLEYYGLEPVTEDIKAIFESPAPQKDIGDDPLHNLKNDLSNVIF